MRLCDTEWGCNDKWDDKVRERNFFLFLVFFSMILNFSRMPRWKSNGSRVEARVFAGWVNSIIPIRSRCNYLAAAVPTTRRNDRANSGREIAIRDDTSCPYRMIRERREVILTRLAWLTACCFCFAHFSLYDYLFSFFCTERGADILRWKWLNLHFNN